MDAKSKMIQMLKLTDEDFKDAIIITISKNSKEMMIGMN